MAVGKLTGPKKAAILLLALGEEGAAEVMKNLEEAEIQQVGYYMTRFNDISSEELDQVLEEFYRQSVMSDGGGDLMASPDFIKNALAAALGPEKAKELNAAMSSQTDDMGLDALKYIDPIMIANYIRTEHPQTIALIISYLTDIDQAATVLRSLPENLQADVVYRIASLDSIPPGVVNELNEVLTDEMKQAFEKASTSMKMVFVNNAVVVGPDGHFALDLNNKCVKDIAPLHLVWAYTSPPPTPPPLDV